MTIAEFLRAEPDSTTHYGGLTDTALAVSQGAHSLAWYRYHRGERQAPPCGVPNCLRPSVWAPDGFGDGSGERCRVHA